MNQPPSLREDIGDFVESPVDIWFHGASVGDMRALAPLVRSCQNRFGPMKYCVSATTDQGLIMGRSLFGSSSVRRAPLWPFGVQETMERTRPRILVLEYLELWPHWVGACHRLGIKVMVVDGRVTQRSLRIRSILHRSAAKLTHFCAQTRNDAAAAHLLGVPSQNITINGNGKYDGIGLEPPPMPAGAAGELGSYDVVIGSLNPAEEVAALRAAAQSGLRVLIAPRYLRRTQPILALARRLGIRASLRSRSGASGQWVILDSVGELPWAYGLGRVAIVGGSFCRRNGQNLVEAAAHRIPVIFGPRTSNISMEVSALEGHGGHRVGSWAEAFGAVTTALRPVGRLPDPLETLMGATERNLTVVQHCLAL